MEDAEIIQLYWDRNEQAISITANKYGSYCGRIAQNILGNQEDAEECVNDTYLKAWHAIPPHKPSVLSVFLGKITRNLSLNRYKYSTAEKRKGGELPAVLAELADCVSGKDTVEREMEYQELVKAIRDFLHRLSPGKQNIFIWRYWYTASIADIAIRCHMKEGAVSMTLCRLRGELRKYLLERGFEL